MKREHGLSVTPPSIVMPTVITNDCFRCAPDYPFSDLPKTIMSRFSSETKTALLQTVPTRYSSDLSFRDVLHLLVTIAAMLLALISALLLINGVLALVLWWYRDSDRGDAICLPIGLVVALLAVNANCYNDVYIDNATDQVVEVRISNKTVSVPPLTHSVVSIASGCYHVQMRDATSPTYFYNNTIAVYRRGFVQSQCVILNVRGANNYVGRERHYERVN